MWLSQSETFFSFLIVYLYFCYWKIVCSVKYHVQKYYTPKSTKCMRQCKIINVPWMLLWEKYSKLNFFGLSTGHRLSQIILKVFEATSFIYLIVCVENWMMLTWKRVLPCRVDKSMYIDLLLLFVKIFSSVGYKIFLIKESVMKF